MVYTAKSTSDLEKFTNLLDQMLRIVWGEGWGVFSPENPTTNEATQTILPHITYNLIRRTITDGRGLKGQVFGSIPDPEHPGETITPIRQWFDCEMEFCVYAKTNKEALEWATRFEQLMDTYRGLFKEEGITEIVFEEENAPDVNSKYRQDIPHRTIRYIVRIERIVEIKSFELKQVGVQLKKLRLKTKTNGDEYITDIEKDDKQVKTHLGNKSFLDLYNEYLR